MMKASRELCQGRRSRTIKTRAFNILQWNSQSMNAHGPEFYKELIENKNSNDAPALICVQESWFTDFNIFSIPDYIPIIKNRGNGGRGGIAIYVHKSITYQEMTCPPNKEYQRIDIFSLKMVISVINFYNPCKKIETHHLKK